MSTVKRQVVGPVRSPVWLRMTARLLVHRVASAGGKRPRSVKRHVPWAKSALLVLSPSTQVFDQLLKPRGSGSTPYASVLPGAGSRWAVMLRPWL